MSTATAIPIRCPLPREMTFRRLRADWRRFDRQRRAAQNQIETVRIFRARRA